MKTTTLTHRVSVTKAVTIGLFGVLLSMPSLTVAHADPRGHYDRGWEAHEVHARRDWHRPHPHPYAVYSPPVVYAPPPPVEESPGINLILPLNFR